MYKKHLYYVIIQYMEPSRHTKVSFLRGSAVKFVFRRSLNFEKTDLVGS